MATINDSLYLYMYGRTAGSSVFNGGASLFIQGGGTSAGYMPANDSLYLFVQQDDTDITYVQGVTLFCHGRNTLNSYISLHIISTDSVDGEATLYVKGWEIVPINSYVNLYIGGGVTGITNLSMPNVHDVLSDSLYLYLHNKNIDINSFSPLYIRGTSGNHDSQKGIPLTLKCDLYPVIDSLYLTIINTQAHLDLIDSLTCYINGVGTLIAGDVALTLYNAYTGLSSSVPLSIIASGMWENYIPFNDSIWLTLWGVGGYDITYVPGVPLFCKAADNPTNSFAYLYTHGVNTLNDDISLVVKGMGISTNSVYLTCVHNGGAPNSYIDLTIFGAYALNKSMDLSIPYTLELLEPRILLYINGY